MAVKRIADPKSVEVKNKTKTNKKNNKGKIWATLNANDKFEIIGNDLIARGIIDA